MANENQLEETSDSIQPIKNGLGITPEIFSEIIREFDRACLSKNITKADIIQFMNQRNSWRVKCIVMGSVSNVIIMSVPEPDDLLNLLNSLGEDIVIDEVLRASLEHTAAKNAEQKGVGKRSTNKIAAPKSGSLAAKKEPENNNPSNIEYRNKKSNTQVIVLSVLGVLGIILAIGGIFIHKSSTPKSDVAKNNSVSEVTIKPEISRQEKTEPVKPIETKPKPEIIKEINETDTNKKVAFNGKMITPDGVVIYQSGSEHFIGGEMVMLSSVRKKSTNSPFMVGNHTGTSYVFIKFDLRNVPADAIIESAHLRFNLTVAGDGAEVFKMYCLPLPKDWSPQTVAYNREGDMSETSYDFFLKNISSAEKISLNLRNDWVSFNVSNSVKDWVTKKFENYGFVVFSDSASSVVFEGFDSLRKLNTPKLALSFGKVKIVEPEKPVDNKPDETKTADKNLPEKEKVIVAKVDKKPEAVEQEEEISDLPLTKDPKTNKPKTDEPKNVFEEDHGLNDTETASVIKNKPKNADKTETKTETKNDSKTETKVENKIDKTETKVDYLIEVSLKDPIIIPNSRLIENTETVRLDNPEGRGEIRYTVDGKDPSPDSLLYSEPFKVSGQLSVIKSAIFIERVRKSNVIVQEYRVAGGQGQLIDNMMSSCKKVGNWESSKSKPNYYGKDYSWEQKGKGTVEWAPSISRKTNCEVYIWLPDGDSVSRSDKAKYTVKFDGGMKEVFVDQTKRNNRWVYLGTFAMKGGAGSVMLQADGSSKMFVADAAYFYFLNEE